MSENNLEHNKLTVRRITTSTFYVPPPPVGYWLIGDNFSIAVMTKPTEQQIANTIKHFGWEWKNREVRK
jgi:hypothetical protein